MHPAGVSAPMGHGKNENLAHGVSSYSAIASSADWMDSEKVWQMGHQFTPYQSTVTGGAAGAT